MSSRPWRLNPCFPRGQPLHVGLFKLFSSRGRLWASPFFHTILSEFPLTERSAESRYAYKSWYNYKEELCPLFTCFLREWAIIKGCASACDLFHGTPAWYAPAG